VKKAGNTKTGNASDANAAPMVRASEDGAKTRGKQGARPSAGTEATLEALTTEEWIDQLGRCNNERMNLLKQAGIDPNPPSSVEGFHFELQLLESGLAAFARDSSNPDYLAAARVLEGLRLNLGREGGASELGKIATQLLRLAYRRGIIATAKGRYPSSLREVRRGTAALERGVQVAMERGQRGVEGWSSSRGIAIGLEIARILNSSTGTERVLPHGGAPEERLDTLAHAVEDVQRFTDPGEQMDPKNIVKKCAKACGYNGQPFRAEQRQEIRKRKRERDKRRA